MRLSGNAKYVPAETYELIISWIINRVDLLLMLVIYLSGTMSIDVFHVLQLIIFAVFVLYPSGARRVFVVYFIFVLIVMSCNYVYVLFIYEFQINAD